MDININDREIFIPVTNGNDQAKEPIRFHLRFLTAGEQSQLDYFEFSAVKGKGEPRVRVKADNNFIFEHGVEKIENLNVNKEEIDTAEKYLSTRGPKWMSDMLLEVALHLKMSMEIDRPN